MTNALPHIIGVTLTAFASDSAPCLSRLGDLISSHRLTHFESNFAQQGFCNYLHALSEAPIWSTLAIGEFRQTHVTCSMSHPRFSCQAFLVPELGTCVPGGYFLRIACRLGFAEVCVTSLSDRFRAIDAVRGSSCQHCVRHLS